MWRVLQSPHCLLDGDASLQLAREFKLPEEEKDYFLTERSLRRFRDVKERHEQWNIVTDKPKYEKILDII